MQPNDAVALLFVLALLTILILYIAKRSFAYREKKLEAEMALAAEKAAQYATSNAELEQRVRVLEQIVTDSGAQTAAQIEALRERPVVKIGEGRA
jgi:uncharacterized protein YpmS